MAKITALKTQSQPKQPKQSEEMAVIKRPDFRTVAIKIAALADSPYVQNRFGSRASGALHMKHAAGSVSKKGAKKEPKDFAALYEDAMHKSAEGWYGIPAAAFRNALISACRVCGFAMTRGKLALFIEADGTDEKEPTPLVKMTKGKPVYFEAVTRNETGVVDLRPRPLYSDWEATVRVRYDADMFSAEDVVNLLARAGLQVGVGEGRPDSKKSNGQGWGMFVITG